MLSYESPWTGMGAPCRRRDWLVTGAAAALAVGCAPVPVRPPQRIPALRLPPDLLGEAAYASSQQLRVYRSDEPQGLPQTVDVQLQLDREGLLLAGFALGQRVLLVRWDGRQLQVQRHAMLPAVVDADRMLRDLVLLYWPSVAIQGALIEPWQLHDSGVQRQLVCANEVVVALAIEGDLHGNSQLELVNHWEGYRLVIRSQALEGAA